MICYVTTIGEKTTEICVQQLERFGFQVRVLSGMKPWIEKYREFIDIAGSRFEDCIRIDADVIVNGMVSGMKMFSEVPGLLMGQCQVYDFYRNGLHFAGPIFYSKNVFQKIQDEFSKLDPNRPETAAWRLPSINSHTKSAPVVVGMHGFFQTPEDIDRAEINKGERHQLEFYDFNLVRKLMKL